VPGQHQKAVTFYGDELVAIQVEDTGAIYLPISRLCDNLGITRARQARRIGEHPVLSRGFDTLTLETPGGPQKTQCLRLDMIPLWLAGINANRVSAEIRDKLIRYQTEVAAVLWAAFKHEIMPTADLTPAIGQSGAALAYELATAVQNIAREQMELEQRLNRAAQWSKGIESRVSALELRLSDDQLITEDQAAELSLAVKAVAHALEQHDTPNPYQRVYGELYRRYGVTSYKNISRDRYDSVIDWLRNWHKEIEKTT
jgi:hypothetical protein